MSSKPTQRQEEIAAFLESEFQMRGMMPTQREIAARFGIARNAVRTHLRLMEQKRMLARLPRKARGLRLKRATPVGIPVIGRIAAGQPQEAFEDCEDVVPVASDFFKGSDLFGLRVKGDSMKDAGILMGDIAILSRQQNVEGGSIAAVLVEDEATLKFLYRGRDFIVLRGANPDFPDLTIRGDQARALRILGKFVGLIRHQP